MPNPFSKLISTVQGKKNKASQPSPLAAATEPAPSPDDAAAQALYHSSTTPAHPLYEGDIRQSTNSDPLPLSAIPVVKPPKSKVKHDERYYVQQMRQLEHSVSATWLGIRDLQLMKERNAPSGEITAKRTEMDTRLAQHHDDLQKLRDSLATDRSISKNKRSKLQGDIRRMDITLHDLIPAPDKIVSSPSPKT